MQSRQDRFDQAIAERRENVLNAEIRRLVGLGYVLQNQTPTAAYLIRPAQKRSFAANLIATIFTAGLWLFVWAVAAIINPFPRDEGLHVEVMVDGSIQRTSTNSGGL